MQAIFLLIWFWLMSGIMFCSATIAFHLLEYEKWYLKVLFWPYYLAVYAIHYIKCFVPDMYYFIKYKFWKLTH